MEKIKAFILIFGLNLRFLLQVTLEQEFFIGNMIIYLILLLSIDFSKHYRYLPFLMLIICTLPLNMEAMRTGFIILVCFFCVKIDIKDIALYNFISGIIVVGIVFYLIDGGILKNESNVYYNALGQLRIRHSLGLGWNKFSLYVFSILINLYILLGEKYKIVVCVIIGGISYLCYKSSGSNTAFYASLVLILSHLFCIYKVNKLVIKRSRIINTLLLFIPFLFILIAIIGGLLLHETLLDSLLSGRLFYINIYLHSITFKDAFIGNANMPNVIMDNSYIRLLFEGGITFFVFFYSIYYKTIKSLDEGNIYLLPVIISFLVIAFSETTLFSIAIIGYATLWIVLYQGAFKYDNK